MTEDSEQLDGHSGPDEDGTPEDEVGEAESLKSDTMIYIIIPTHPPCC